MFVVDELTIFLVVLAIGLTAVLVLTQHSPDVPPAKLVAQSETSRTRLQGESVIYRSRASYSGLITHHYQDVRTLYEAFQRGLRNHPERRCLGTRYNDGDFQWTTYAETDKLITNIGSGLQKLGIPSGQQTFIGIFSINRMEWSVVDNMCSAYSMVNVAVYDTLGTEAVRHIINQTEQKAIFSSGDKLPLLLRIAAECPSLKLVISFDPITPDIAEKAAVQKLQLMQFKDLAELGAKNPQPHVPPTPEDLATICYTSGTTGTPKGVMLTHKNMIANNAAILASFPKEILPTHEDTYLSYLPLAHMLERLIHIFVFASGASVGFFRGDTKKLLDDVALLRPTYFVSVPRLWNRIYDRVLASVNESDFIKRNMFYTAYAAKLRLLRQGIVTHSTIWDMLVFNKIRARLGGRVKALVTGAAPIAPEVIDMLRICFGVQVYEGYGQSEAVAAITVTQTGDYTSGHVGPPLPCVELKLIDVDEMSYLVTDKPNPRGEICVRGTSVASGYYKEPEKTQSTWDKDGWLMTGDIGEILPNGVLKVIDRKKNIFKLSQGEYIAAEKIENIITKSTFIEQAWVYGDSLKSHLVAVIVPDPEALQPWAKNNNLPTDMFSLCKTKQVKEHLLSEIQKVCKESKLFNFEIPSDIFVEPESFSVDNNLLTPSFKLRRNEAKSKYKEVLENLYKVENINRK